MDRKLVLYDLAPSPNNAKVRIALGFKGLPYEKVPVDPADVERDEVIRVSGQPLTPVLLHGDTVVYDSRAILRYLDNNFRETPPLFSTDYQEMQEIERLESFARSELAEPVRMTFYQWRSEQPDAAVCERASALLTERTATIEERLAESEWLVDGRLTAADVTAVPLVALGMLPEEAAAQDEATAFFVEHLRLGDGRDRTRDWVQRVLAYDR